MNLLGKAMDKQFWQSVRTNECFKRHVDELHKIYEEKCSSPIEVLSYSDFRLFWDTGDRSVYEKAYFRRRLAMDATALLSLIYPEEQKYLERLMNEIYAICDEYTWCLPAHQGQNTHNDNTRLDLFSTETGFALAEIYTMLKDRLDPLISSRIEVEIKRRIVEPFLAVDSYGWWESGTNNWAAVCMSSIACTFMLMHPDKLDSILPRVKKTMEGYLSGFADDGVCTEGCGYWYYGFGFFVTYADMIKTYTNGKVDYFTRTKVKTIATFVQKMFLTENVSVSFADGNKTVNYHLGLLHKLKSIYPDDVLVYNSKYSFNYEGCGRFCLHLRSFTWFSEDYYLNPADADADSVYYATNAQWFVRRTPNYSLAAKGGHNQEMHNHNDVGSFIYAKDGRQILCDAGAGRYTRQYFSNERYTLFHCSSRGHSVPIVNGIYQQVGAEYAARNTAYENGVFSTDIAGAYPVKELHSFIRSFECNDGFVRLTDRYDYDGEGDVIERIVTLKEPQLCADATVLVDGAALMYDAESVADVTVTSETVNSSTYYLLDFVMKKNATEFVLVIQ